MGGDQRQVTNKANKQTNKKKEKKKQNKQTKQTNKQTKIHPAVQVIGGKDPNGGAIRGKVVRGIKVKMIIESWQTNKKTIKQSRLR